MLYPSSCLLFHFPKINLKNCYIIQIQKEMSLLMQKMKTSISLNILVKIKI